MALKCFIVVLYAFYPSDGGESLLKSFKFNFDVLFDWIGFLTDFFLSLECECRERSSGTMSNYILLFWSAWFDKCRLRLRLVELWSRGEQLSYLLDLDELFLIVFCEAIFKNRFVYFGASGAFSLFDAPSTSSLTNRFLKFLSVRLFDAGFILLVLNISAIFYWMLMTMFFSSAFFKFATSWLCLERIVLLRLRMVVLRLFLINAIRFGFLKFTSTFSALFYDREKLECDLSSSFDNFDGSSSSLLLASALWLLLYCTVSSKFVSEASLIMAFSDALICSLKLWIYCRTTSSSSSLYFLVRSLFWEVFLISGFFSIFVNFLMKNSPILSSASFLKSSSLCFLESAYSMKLVNDVMCRFTGSGCGSGVFFVAGSSCWLGEKNLPTLSTGDFGPSIFVFVLSIGDCKSSFFLFSWSTLLVNIFTTCIFLSGFYTFFIVYCFLFTYRCLTCSFSFSISLYAT